MTVKLVKSLIGAKKDQIATAHALGLRKIGKRKQGGANNEVT